MVGDTRRIMAFFVDSMVNGREERLLDVCSAARTFTQNTHAQYIHSCNKHTLYLPGPAHPAPSKTTDQRLGETVVLSLIEPQTQQWHLPHSCLLSRLIRGPHNARQIDDDDDEDETGHHSRRPHEFVYLSKSSGTCHPCRTAALPRCSPTRASSCLGPAVSSNRSCGARKSSGMRG